MRIFVSSGPIHKNKVQVADTVPIIAVAFMIKMRSSCQGCTEPGVEMNGIHGLKHPFKAMILWRY